MKSALPMTRFILVACTCALVLSCLPDQLAWSPDGRYLGFVRPADKSIWIWDSQTGESRKLKSSSVEAFGWISASEIVYGTDIGSILGANNYEFKIVAADSGASIRKLSQSNSRDMAITRDSKEYWYVGAGESEGISALWRAKLGESAAKSEIALKHRGILASPQPDSTGANVLFSFENENEKGIGLLNADSGTTQSLIASSGDSGAANAVWVKDNESFVYLQSSGTEAQAAELHLYLLKTKENRLLHPSVSLFSRPSVSPDQKMLAVTVMNGDPGHPFSRLDSMVASMMQIALIDIASGKATILTDEELGAEWPVFDPAGKRVAYLSPPIPAPFQRAIVRDLGTGERTVIAHDTEDKAFVAAEESVRKNPPAEALKAMEECLSHSASGRYRDPANFYIAAIALDPQINDPDKAFDAIRRMESKNRIYPEQLFWSDKDRIAQDPAEDWITAYGTEDSEEGAGFKTDLTRDLRGLSAKWGKERLYLRVDYGSGKDLHGRAFQDTIILFDYNSPESGSNLITTTTKWDRGAERQLIFHHMADDLQDLELLDEQGRPVGSSGQNSGGFSQVLVTEEKNGPGFLTFAIPIKSLGLPGNGTSISVQVCTVKNGDGSRETGERLRTLVENDRAVCDIADAFGAENTAARLHDKAHAEKGFVVKGEAGKLVAP